jgi:hypothetical protein
MDDQAACTEHAYTILSSVRLTEVVAQIQQEIFAEGVAKNCGLTSSSGEQAAKALAFKMQVG